MTLESQLEAWAKRASVRAESVVKTAVQAVADDANLEGPSVANPDGGRGGRMPIDQGFLKGSIAAAVGEMPRGPTRPTDTSVTTTSPAIAIAGWDMRESLYIGWTAEYAELMENRYGFMEGALQKWPDFVRAALSKTEGMA